MIHPMIFQLKRIWSGAAGCWYWSSLGVGTELVFFRGRNRYSYQVRRIQLSSQMSLLASESRSATALNNAEAKNRLEARLAADSSIVL